MNLKKSENLQIKISNNCIFEPMLKLICKFEKWEEQKTQVKITFTFKNLPEELRENLKQYENCDGFLLFHVDRFRMEVIKLLEQKKSFIDDLGNSPSKKMMIALKNRFQRIKKNPKFENKTWEDYYPETIDYIIKNYIDE